MFSLRDEIVDGARQRTSPRATTSEVRRGEGKRGRAEGGFTWCTGYTPDFRALLLDGEVPRGRQPADAEALLLGDAEAGALVIDRIEKDLDAAVGVGVHHLHVVLGEAALVLAVPRRPRRRPGCPSGVVGREANAGHGRGQRCARLRERGDQIQKGRRPATCQMAREVDRVAPHRAEEAESEGCHAFEWSCAFCDFFIRKCGADLATTPAMKLSALIESRGVSPVAVRLHRDHDRSARAGARGGIRARVS